MPGTLSTEEAGAVTAGANEVEALAQLRQGDRLDLGGRELAQLPDVLAELTDLRELRLSWNRFEQLPPQVLALTNLELLDLSSLPLRGLPAGLSRLSRLRVLLMDDNRLTTFPEVLTRMTALQLIDMGGTYPGGARMRGLPETIHRMSLLQQLRLHGSRFPELPAGLFELHRLQWLDLSHCELPNKIPEALGRLKALRRLDLERSSWDLPGVLKRVQQLLPRCEIVLG